MERFAETSAPLFRPVAGISIAVHLDFPVQSLVRQAADAMRSSSSVGSEIGGLLLGHVTRGEPTIVTVENYELVPCDYSQGPLYRFGKADSERLRQAIARNNRTARELAVVGFFRSHTRAGLALDADDQALCAEQFNGRQQIAMLVQSLISQTVGLGIFVWDNGEMRGSSTSLTLELPNEETTKSSPPPTAPIVNTSPASVHRTPREDPPVSESPRPPAVLKPPTVVPIGPPRTSVQPMAESISPIPAPSVQGVAPAPPVKRAASVGIVAEVGRCSRKMRVQEESRRPNTELEPRYRGDRSDR